MFDPFPDDPLSQTDRANGHSGKPVIRLPKENLLADLQCFVVAVFVHQGPAKERFCSLTCGIKRQRLPKVFFGGLPVTTRKRAPAFFQMRRRAEMVMMR